MIGVSDTIVGDKLSRPFQPRDNRGSGDLGRVIDTVKRGAAGLVEVVIGGGRQHGELLGQGRVPLEKEGVGSH
jgi:hypothetical protein